jgi:hypothetical protein
MSFQFPKPIRTPSIDAALERMEYTEKIARMARMCNCDICLHYIELYERNKHVYHVPETLRIKIENWSK